MKRTKKSATVAIIDELMQEYKLKVLLKVAKINKSTYEYNKSKRHIEYIKRKEKKTTRNI